MDDNKVDLDSLIYNTSNLSEEITKYIVNYEENERFFLRNIIDIDVKEGFKENIVEIIKKLKDLDWYKETFLNDLMFEGSGPIYSNDIFFKEINIIIDGYTNNFKNNKDIEDFFRNINNEELLNQKFRNTIAGLYIDGKIENLVKNEILKKKIKYTFIKRIIYEIIYSKITPKSCLTLVKTYEEIKDNKNTKKEILKQYRDRINYQCFNYEEKEVSELNTKLESTFEDPIVLKYILDMNLNYEELLVLYFLTISYFPEKKEENRIDKNIRERLRDINTTTSNNSFDRKQSLIYQYNQMVRECRNEYDSDPNIEKNYSKEEIKFMKDFPIGTYIRYISKVRRKEYEEMNDPEYYKKTKYGTVVAYENDDDSNKALNESNNRYDNLRDKINFEYGVITGYYQPSNVEYKQAQANAYSIFPPGTDIIYKDREGQIAKYEPKTNEYQINMKDNNESFNVLVKDIIKDYESENYSKYTYYNGPDFVQGLSVKIIKFDDANANLVHVKLKNIDDSGFKINKQYLYRASDNIVTEIKTTETKTTKITTNNEINQMEINTGYYDVKIKGGVFNGLLGKFALNEDVAPNKKKMDINENNFLFKFKHITGEEHPIELKNLLFLYKLSDKDIEKIKEKKQIEGEIILNVPLNYVPKFFKIDKSGNIKTELNEELNKKYNDSYQNGRNKITNNGYWINKNDVIHLKKVNEFKIDDKIIIKAENINNPDIQKLFKKDKDKDEILKTNLEAIVKNKEDKEIEIEIHRDYLKLINNDLVSELKKYGEDPRVKLKSMTEYYVENKTDEEYETDSKVYIKEGPYRGYIGNFSDKNDDNLEKINLVKLSLKFNGSDSDIIYFNPATATTIEGGIKNNISEDKFPINLLEGGANKETSKETTEHGNFGKCDECNMKVKVRFKMEKSSSYNEYIQNQINFFKHLKNNILNDLRKTSKFENETQFIPLNKLNVFKKAYTTHILDLKSLMRNRDKDEYIDVYPFPETLMKIKSFEYYVKEGTTVRIRPTPVIESIMNSVYKLGKMVFGAAGKAISMVYHFVLASFNSLSFENIAWLTGAAGRTIVRGISSAATFASESSIANFVKTGMQIGVGAGAAGAATTATTAIVGTAAIAPSTLAIGAIGASALAVFLAKSLMSKYASVDAGDIYDVEKENISSVQEVSLEMKKKSLEELKRDFKEYGNSSKSTLQGIFGSEEAIVLKYDRFKQKCLIQFKKSKKKILISGKNLEYKLSLGETRGKKATETMGTTLARTQKSLQESGISAFQRRFRARRARKSQQGGMQYFMKGGEQDYGPQLPGQDSRDDFKNTMGGITSLMQQGEIASAASSALNYSASQMGAAAYSALPVVAPYAAALGAAAIISNAAADAYIREDNKRTNIEYKGPGSYQDDGYILYGKKGNIAKRNYELQKDQRRWHDVPEKTSIEKILVDRHIFIKSDLKKCLKNKETQSFQFLSYSKSFLLEAITDKEYDIHYENLKDILKDIFKKHKEKQKNTLKESDRKNDYKTMTSFKKIFIEYVKDLDVEFFADDINRKKNGMKNNSILTIGEDGYDMTYGELQRLETALYNNSLTQEQEKRLKKYKEFPKHRSILNLGKMDFCPKYHRLKYKLNERKKDYLKKRHEEKWWIQKQFGSREKYEEKIKECSKHDFNSSKSQQENEYKLQSCIKNKDCSFKQDSKSVNELENRNRVNIFNSKIDSDGKCVPKEEKDNNYKKDEEVIRWWIRRSDKWDDDYENNFTGYRSTFNTLGPFSLDMIYELKNNGFFDKRSFGVIGINDGKGKNNLFYDELVKIFPEFVYTRTGEELKDIPSEALEVNTDAAFYGLNDYYAPDANDPRYKYKYVYFSEQYI